MLVYADLRWPARTGIGVIQEQLLARIPESLKVEDLRVQGRIGSPLSPLAISWQLGRRRTPRSVFWSPGFVPPFPSRMTTVVTVHDLMHLHHYTRLHAAYYHLVFKRLYNSCTVVICVSDFTRREFLEWSKMPAHRVITVHNGVSARFGVDHGTQALPFPYVFYPGNRRSNKNLPRLLAAFAASRLPSAGISLVLTGQPDRQLADIARKLGVGERLHFAGHLEEDALIDVYRNARLVAFVSLYEGFGLPIIEAMAAGVPVLTSNVTSMPEIAGGAAVLIDPLCVEQISHGLERLAFDEEERHLRIRLGATRATQFGWDRCANDTWKVVASAQGAGASS